MIGEPGQPGEPGDRSGGSGGTGGTGGTGGSGTVTGGAGGTGGLGGEGGRANGTRLAHRRLAAYLLIVAVFVIGMWRIETTVNRLDTVVTREEAERCVASWQVRGEIREAIVIPGEAIIEVATDADPERVEQFRAGVDRRIREAFPNPDCSLTAARAVLDP